MLKTQFRLDRPYRVVIYVRMSTDRQNPRSPDQQLETIRTLIARMRLPWVVTAIYRDDGISGRYKRKRIQFQKMIHELKAGIVKADLILVDTFERLSRGDDNAEIRSKLAKIGVLVLTADSQFQDPTTVSGRALTMVESLRSTEDGRVKAHNVVRGKKDAVRLGHWPGGPVPFGFRLKIILTIRKGSEEVDYRVLEPVEELLWIIVLIFQLAAERGWGGERIAQHVNQHPQLPADLRFQPSTIDYILRNRIYYGELVWGANCTGIIDDVRVLQSLPADEWEINPTFCKAIVEKSVFDVVEAHRSARQRKKGEESEITEETIGVRAPGVALTYPLSGLVVCGSCGRAMIASSSSAYVTVNGEERRYVSYVCRASRPGSDCDNSCHVPEAWLRNNVFAIIRSRLFLEVPVIRDESCVPPCDDADLRERILSAPAFVEFMTLVRQMLERMRPQHEFNETALEKKKSDLTAACRGWRLSLGDPDLDADVRSLLEEDLANARRRMHDIDRSIDEIRSNALRSEAAVDPAAVVERLFNLGEVLSRNCASATNLILAQHIESIRCFPDGKVIVRNCSLGALANPFDFCGSANKLPAEPQSADAEDVVTGRRRTRRRVAVEFDEEEQAQVANDFAIDPTRFAGLPSEWFTEDIFQVPERISWAEEHAMAVATFRIEQHATMEVTIAHFGKSKPTIQQALKYAKDLHGIDALGKDVSVKSRRFWPRDNAKYVAEFFSRPGATMKEAIIYFGKSQPWISKARKIAQEQSAASPVSDSVGSERPSNTDPLTDDSHNGEPRRDCA
jgi:DNA invertase Pin-like site-specific DNA recombinase